MNLDSAKKKLVKGRLLLAQAGDDPDLLKVSLAKIHAALEEACRLWLSAPSVVQQHQRDIQNRTQVSWPELLALMPKYYAWNVEDVEYVHHFNNLYQQAIQDQEFLGRREEIEDYAIYVESLFNQELATSQIRQWNQSSQTSAITPSKPWQASLWVAYALWAVGFLPFLDVFGLCGLHRFYLRRPVTGLMWLCSFGFLYLGQLLDFFLLPKMVEEFNSNALHSPTYRSLPLGDIGQQILNKLDRLDRRLQQRLFKPEKRHLSRMHKLLKVAAANGKVLSMGQAVMATGLQPDEVQQLFNEAIRTGIAHVGNETETGAVRYYFDI